MHHLPLQFSWGTTRFVVLVGPVAIKIARFRILCVVRETLLSLIAGVPSRRLLIYDDDPVRSGFKHLFAGLIANRVERLVWVNVPQDFMLPTLWSFFYLVNIQPRGKRITNERDYFVELPRDIFESLDAKVDNFCHYRGHILMCDYGAEETLSLLSPTPPLETRLATK